MEEWQSSKKGLVIQLDPDQKRSRRCLEYVSPPEVCAEDSPAILFKSASLHGNRLYTCTSTEVLIYELPTFRLVSYVSLPCFNDVHHVCPSKQGTLLIAVTGLDMVVEITPEGKVLREWNVLGEDPWDRFSRAIDYRQVATTKPHRSHPNHVFQLGNEIWVTRFRQRDAICLTAPGRIDIGVQSPHDGYLFGHSIYFTTVDGHVVLASQSTLEVEKIFDLNEMGNSSQQVLGWCRGLLPLDERRIWVGFTRVRPTKFRENLAWIKNGYSHRHKPSHIALYDLECKACLKEIPLEPHGIGIVFSLLEPYQSATLPHPAAGDQPGERVVQADSGGHKLA